MAVLDSRLGYRWKPYLIHAKTSLVDECLFLFLTGIRMIKVVLKPLSEDVGDLFGQVSSSTSVSTICTVHHARPSLRVHIPRNCADRRRCVTAVTVICICSWISLWSRVIIRVPCAISVDLWLRRVPGRCWRVCGTVFRLPNEER